MSIQRSFTILLGFIVCFFVGLFVSIALLVRNTADIEQAEQRQFRSEMIATRLRQSSDDLTRMARMYVVTGEQRYKDYFEEIISIRNGTSPRPENYDMVYWDLVDEAGNRPQSYGENKSIDELMIEEGFTIQEFQKLQEARNRSDALAVIETVAMNAMVGMFDDGTGAFAVSGEPDMELAIRKMFDADYMAAKAEIMAPVNEVIGMIKHRTAGEVEKYINRGHLLAWVALAFCAGSLVASSGMLYLLKRRVLRPLHKAMDSVEKVNADDLKSPIDYRAYDEMGTFVKAYNAMLERMGFAVTRLEDTNQQLKLRGDELVAEKERSDQLLLNVLPACIADRLKKGETTIADTFPEVTVLFADLVGFTPLTEKLGPHEMVRVLNEVFALMDREAEKFGVEKIKTIGDAYMAVSGLPIPTVDHAHNIARFALGASASINEYATRNGIEVQLRVGIHSGTAVAGIIGKKRFIYDIWGDVVNVASRMESSGVPSQIQVSEPTMVRLRDLFELQPIGEIDVKGKGLMKTWRLVGDRYHKLENN